MNDNLKTIGAITLAAVLLVGGQGLLRFIDAREQHRLNTDRIEYFYKSLPQGQGEIIREYDVNHDGVLGTSEISNLFDNYGLSKR